MKWSSVVFGSVVALLGLAVPASVSAGPIIGHLNLAGAVIYDTRAPAGGGLATIDFDPTFNAAGNGNVLTVGGATGYFAGVGGGCVGTCLPNDGLSFGSSGKILDITNDPTAVPPATLAPAGVPLAVTNFLNTFLDPDGAGLHFDLTELVLQGGSACTGAEGLNDSCVEGPFAITQTAQGLRINFDVLGYFRNGGDQGFYRGAFSTTFGGLTFAEAFRRLDISGQDLMCGVSATNTAQTNNLQTSCSMDVNFDPTAVPEPASLLTFGAGAALLAMVRRRRAVKASKA